MTLGRGEEKIETEHFTKWDDEMRIRYGSGLDELCEWVRISDGPQPIAQEQEDAPEPANCTCRLDSDDDEEED